jgi:predicted acetyltransferase
VNISLIEIDESNKNTLKEMFQVYVLEMTRFLDQNDQKTKSIEPLSILNRYWEQTPNWPYFLVLDGEIAGFCLLRRYPGEPATIDIDQYFVSAEFRRQNIGRSSLEKLVKKHPGSWLIRVLKTNTGALKFWLHAVEASVGSDYESKYEREDMLYIRFDTKLS